MATTHPRAVVRAADDHVRTYTPGEEEQLALNLRGVQRDVYRGEYHAAPVGVPLLCELHGRLFAGVRGHAGRHRRADFGSEVLDFGPNKSLPREQIPARLDLIMTEVRRGLASFARSPDDPAYVARAIHLCVWAHAELIAAHPFEDGNGRTTRLFMDWMLIRLGLAPIPIDAVKQEYNACLNAYQNRATRDLQPLIDLYIRLATD